MIALDKLSSLLKQRGFFYPSADLYDGINGFYDKGHLGVLLSRKIQHIWEKNIQSSGIPTIHFDGSLIGPERMWKASGHRDGFTDPLIDCKNCKFRYKADDVIQVKPCSRCGIKDWSEIKDFDLMFATHVGSNIDSSSSAFLRPETAQSLFIQFKNIYSTNRVKLPFCAIQTGRAFRNEITPRHFLFRTREFTQMEAECFCFESDAPMLLDTYLNIRKNFYSQLGFSPDTLRTHEQSNEERAHYAQKTYDIEFKFPFGWKELEGISYRGSYDLTAHTQNSGKSLAIHNDLTLQSEIPHVVEVSTGIERLMLALLCSAYKEEKLENGDSRIVLQLPKELAPITYAILPLTKHERKYAQDIYQNFLSQGKSVIYDESGSIGKRYRRYDEIGTPYCITIDKETIESGEYTIRDRDSMIQERKTLESKA